MQCMKVFRDVLVQETQKNSSLFTEINLYFNFVNPKKVT